MPLVDGHNDLPWTLRETFASDLSRVDLRQRGATVDTDIPRLREGRVSGQFWSVFIPSGLPNPARTQLEQIELARRMIDAYPDTFLFATRAADVERARQQGKIASFLGMENGQAIENSLGALRAYYALGVRYMTLTHGKNNDWADSATDTAGARRADAVRARGGARDEPARHAGRHLARLAGRDAPGPRRLGGAGHLLALERPRPGRSSAQRPRRRAGPHGEERRRRRW